MKLAPCIVLLATCVPALADSPAIYESLEQIPIGRIFLTPEERRDLDRRRWSTPIARQGSATGPAKTSRKSFGGFGYIILDDGTLSTWIDGEFRSGEERDAPGGPPKRSGFTIISNDIANSSSELAENPESGTAQGTPTADDIAEPEVGDDQDQ